MVRGPAKGYVSDAKQEYREKVWASFPDYIVDYCANVSDCYVLLMPSREGKEIGVAIERGIPEEKIICVDESPAIIAVSEWRKKYPKCRFYGAKISEVGYKLNKNGRRIIAANLDFCNNFSSELIAETEEFINTAPFYKGFCISITIAKGRENKATTTLLNMVLGSYEFMEIKDKRARALFSAIYYNLIMDGDVLLLGQGSYVHNRTPMTWLSIGNARNEDMREHFRECDAKSKDMIEAFDRLMPKISDAYTCQKKAKKEKAELMSVYEKWKREADKFELPNNLIKHPNIHDQYVFRSLINRYSEYMVEASNIQSNVLYMARQH